jgi:hypothetical protein
LRRLTFLAIALPCAALSALAVQAAFPPALAAPADEPRRTIDVGRVFDAGLPHVDTPTSFQPTPPDPPPLVEAEQRVFDLRWDRGEVWLLGVQALHLQAPQQTPRVMGRFALELFEGPGPALVERVRFDFPLLGPPEGDAGPSIAAKLRTRIGVMFPATTRGMRLELVDRATGRRWALPWPVKVAGADGG